MSKEKFDINYVARLSRIKLNEKEKEKFSQQLEQILSYIEKLNTLTTDHVVPTSHVLPLNNVLREDEVKSSLEQEKVLANAPCSAQGGFRVPKIIE